MIPHPLIEAFEERKEQVELYLDLLDSIALEAMSGVPRLATTNAVITTDQQKVLHASVFLQLYNLVEATIARCLSYATETAMTTGTWKPAQLTEQFRKEWVRVMARTHTDLNYEHRLTAALDLAQTFVAAMPVQQFEFEKGGGGNWDDGTIETVAKRIGMPLTIAKATRTSIKRKFKNDLSCLKLVVKSRNHLAHGNISFVDAGDGFTASELRDLAQRTTNYMREVVQSFVSFLDGHNFLVETARPGYVAPPPTPPGA